MLFSSDLVNTQRRMAQWVVTGILFQLFSPGSQFTSPSSSNKLDNKLFGRLKSFELDNRIGSSGFRKFEYPKEDTTHGVGYGHHLHPFYYQGFTPLYSCAIQGEWYPIAHHAYHSNTIQNHGRSGSGLNNGVTYNPPMYSTDYISSKNSIGRKTVTPENHLKHFLHGIPTTFTLKRADISLDSVSEKGFNQRYTTEHFYEQDAAPELQPHHNVHIHPKSSNKTAASQSNDNEGIPTYLTPPLPPTPPMDSAVQLQQLLPHKKHYNLKEEHKLVDILTTLHILPHPEEIDYF